MYLTSSSLISYKALIFQQCIISDISMYLCTFHTTIAQQLSYTHTNIIHTGKSVWGLLAPSLLIFGKDEF